jgi:hypothetical protein
MQAASGRSAAFVCEQSLENYCFKFSGRVRKMLRGWRQSGKRTARPGRPPHHLPQGAQQDRRGAPQGDSSAQKKLSG